MKRLLPLIALLALAGTLRAQTETEFTFFGQARIRAELDTKGMAEGTHTDVPYYLRARLGGSAVINKKISAVVEIQDARRFGESGTVKNEGAPSLDLRQGYLRLEDAFKYKGLALKAGRMVMTYANERLIGAAEWGEYGQSFDGGVLTYASSGYFIDVLGADIVQRSVDNAGYNRDTYLVGFWGGYKPEKGSTLQIFGLHDTPILDVMGSDARLYRNTAGLYANGAYGGFDYTLDGAYQFGTFTYSGDEWMINGMMVGVRVGWTFEDFGMLRVGAGYDRLSGLSDTYGTDKEWGAFSTLYASNHRFYGHMDYFLDIPQQTEGLGLQDIMFSLSAKPVDPWTFGADFHLFSTVTDPTAVEGTPFPSTATTAIGMEVDLYAKVMVYEALDLSGGFSLFDGDPDRVVIPGRKTTNWAWLMGTVNF